MESIIVRSLSKNGSHYAKKISKSNFFSESVWIFIKISKKHISKGPLNSNLAIVQIMTLHWTSDKTIIWTSDGQVYWRICVSFSLNVLTRWGRMTHICVSELTIIGSYNGLSPGWRQAIIWNNAGLLWIEPLEKASVKFQSEFKHFHSRKCTWTCRLWNGVHFVSASMC